MLRTEHNGEGFHYLVSYKRHDNKSREVHKKVDDWRQSELVVDGQETYKDYEISVQAVNNIGAAPNAPDRKLGYSGEDGT